MKKTIFVILLTAVSMSLLAWENHNWLTEYDWSLEDGRDIDDPRADHIYWHSHDRPYVKFHIFNMPSNSVFYQVRLRNEMFYFLYQTEEKDKFFPLGTSFGTEAFDIEFRNNFSSMSRYRNGTPWGSSARVGQQENHQYPLVGIWGSLPSLNEYRLIEPSNCIYYLEIDKEIPGWAVREGTYLLRQTGDKVFETISSFPDGHLRLEIRSQQLILLTPLFTLQDEKGMIAPLAMRRRPRS
jgi:hypothetical protein